MAIERSSGILMPIASLPSRYGIGSLGKAAYDFVDFLERAGQSWWQILPVGPTSYGDSPYTSFSTFAGNPYFVDLDILIEDGLLTTEDLAGIDWGDNARSIDYGKIYENRFDVLRKAAQRGIPRDRESFDTFIEENRAWLCDYALYMAVKKHFGMSSWLLWEDDGIRTRKPGAVEKYRTLLRDDIEFFEYVQFLFFGQWEALHAYAREKGVGIIGDLPIYVALDSADVWSEPEFFALDEELRPVEVSGCPPDYFCEDGQLWGNPVYDWERLRADGYGWWIRRIAGNARLYDVLRIDHFRGFESFWAVPYGDKTARNGRWVKGPGMDLVGRLTSWFSEVDFIAEDLGFMTEGVMKLLKDSGLPGMKVLQFAFDSREPSNYLPHTYDPNCICYTGTHDNTTVMGWQLEADPDDFEYAKRYLGINDAEGLNWGMIRGGMSSVARLFVTQIQDYLELGAECRINTPGTLGNWKWRLCEGEISDELTEKIAAVTKMYGRAGAAVKTAEKDGE